MEQFNKAAEALMDKDLWDFYSQEAKQEKEQDEFVSARRKDLEKQTRRLHEKLSKQALKTAK